MRRQDEPSRGAVNDDCSDFDLDEHSRNRSGAAYGRDRTTSPHGE